jgi:hypothetical protein
LGARKNKNFKKTLIKWATGIFHGRCSGIHILPDVIIYDRAAPLHYPFSPPQSSWWAGGWGNVKKGSGLFFKLALLFTS